MGFKDRLKEAREAKGLKQIDLSAKCGLSKGAVSNYEAGISFPNIATLYKIFDILDVDPNYLFQDEVKIDNRRGALSSREIVLLNKYSKLHSIDQTKVDTYIDDLLENRKYTDKIIELNTSGRINKDKLENEKLVAYSGKTKETQPPIDEKTTL